MANSARPPRLPREFYRRSAAGGFGFIVYALTLWLVPSWCATLLLRDPQRSAWEAGPIVFALTLLGAHGLHLTGWIGHEGFHFNLVRHRLTSAVLGIVFSSVTVFFVQVGVAIDHHNHHRYANTPADPDYRLFEPQSGFWSRLFFTRLRANRIFLRDAWRLVRGRPLAMDERWLPFPRSIYRRLALLNLACCAGWLLLYARVAAVEPLLVVGMVLLPLLCANLISGLRPYLEHAGTDAGLTTCARSRTHWLLTLLYYGNALHLEHHLYPAVPCYRLPRVHRWLKAARFFPSDFDYFEPSLLADYRFALRRYPYGARARGRA